VGDEEGVNDRPSVARSGATRLTRFHAVPSRLDIVSQAIQTEMVSFLTVHHPRRLSSPPSAMIIFKARTSIVWDVDPIADCIHIYRAENPDQPTNFRRGQTIDVEPLLPGWRVDVDWIFA
jgi:hypothetical protein